MSADDKREQSEAKCCRQQYWNEVGIEEKAERTREAVKDLQREVADLRKTVWDLLHHQHSQQGQITVPVNDRLGPNEVCSRRGRRDEETYF